MIYNKNILKIINNKNIKISDLNEFILKIINNNLKKIELSSTLYNFRLKGETNNEIFSFLNSIYNYSSFLKIFLLKYKYSPIIIPSYNNYKNSLNFIPLISFILSKKIPILIHGNIDKNKKIINTSKILNKLGIKIAYNINEINFQIKKYNFSFLSIDLISSIFKNILNFKHILGTKNFLHLLIKILQPFNIPATRIIPYTHKKYFNILSKYFIKNNYYRNKGNILLIKAREGEILNIKKNINLFNNGINIILNNNYKYYKNNKINFKTNINLIKKYMKNNYNIPKFIKNQIKFFKKISKI